MGSNSEKTDDRLRYRATLESPEQLSVEATDHEGRKRPAQLLDLSAGGIGLSFPPDEDPGLRIGQTTYLHLKSPEQSTPLVALVQVSRESKFDWGHTYGCKFVDWIGLLAQIPPGLAALFNRRGQQRIAIEPMHQIKVAIEGPATSAEEFRPVQGILRDLSSTGLSFRIEREHEEHMSSCPTLHVSFALPGAEKVMSFWVQILYRDEDGQDVVFGAMFDPQSTAGFAHKQESLSTCLRQLLDVKEPI